MLLSASRRGARCLANDIAASCTALRAFATSKQTVISVEALDPEREGNASARAAALKDLLAACRTGSFTAKMGSYASSGLVSSVYKQTTSFHALPDNVKEAYHFSKDRNQRRVSIVQEDAPRGRFPGRGWVPLFEEPAYEPGTVAHVTSFDLARELPADDPAVLRGEKGMGQNVWPRELPAFRQDVSRYYDATSDVATARRWRSAQRGGSSSCPKRFPPVSSCRPHGLLALLRPQHPRLRRNHAQVLFQAFAEMLQLPRDAFLRSWSHRSRDTMRLMRYPGGISAEEAQVRNFGIAAHTDFEAFTLLHQDAPGLQLQLAGGAWVDAPVPALDECTVIIGDMIEVWTNGHVKATRHRVALVPWQRTSLIRFVGLDNDALVQPLPQFGEPKYCPRTQAAHLDAMMDEAEKQRDEVKAAGAASGAK